MRLSEVAASVAEDLQAAGLKTSDFVPPKVVPPLVIIGTGDPYVEEGKTYNQSEFVVHLELFCVTGTATNSAATTALNEMIETVIFNLGDWTIDGVSAPYMASANDAQYLTARVSITKTITIGDDSV